MNLSFSQKAVVCGPTEAGFHSSLLLHSLPLNFQAVAFLIYPH